MRGCNISLRAPAYVFRLCLGAQKRIAIFLRGGLGRLQQIFKCHLGRFGGRRCAGFCAVRRLICCAS